MMSESETDMLERWMGTNDKQEYMRIGKIIMPDVSEEELEKSFEESMVGYRQQQTAG